MPLRKPVTSESYIRELPMSAYRKLESLLDPGNLWEVLMENIPQYLDSSSKSTRYTAQDGLNIQNKSYVNRKGPTALLLDDWSTQNPRIRHLIDVLTVSELYAAADYLSVDILKGSPVPRVGQSTVSSQCTEAPAGPRSFNSDSCDSCRKPTSGKPGEHNELSFNDKCESSNQQLTQLMRKPCTLLKESLSSGEDLKSLALLESPPPQMCEVKCEPTENDETDQMKEKFKKIDIDEEKQDHSPRIPYNILCEITDNFNDRDFFSGGRLLGSGGFGSVYLGVKQGLRVAVKRLFDTTEEQTKLFETELQVLSKFQHENLVPLLGYSCGPKFCLVYAYMVNGSIEDRLKCKNNTDPLTVLQRVNIAKGTAQGIHYLNSNNIIHRDIKSANVLLDENFAPKVGDFATARRGPEDTTSVITIRVTGTAAYLAPEAYQHDVSVKLDSFSYGVVLLELLTGLPVVDCNRDERDLKSHIAEHCDNDEDIHKFLDNSAGNWSTELVDNVYHIAKQCLVDRKRRRVAIADILPEIQKLSCVNSCTETSSTC